MNLKKIINKPFSLINNLLTKKEILNVKPTLKYNYILDAGHGGIDSEGNYTTPGKRSPKFEDGYVLYEGELNRYIANKVKLYLTNNYNCKIDFVHEEIRDTPLTERVLKAKEIHKKTSNPIIYISIHSNAFKNDWGSAHGWEIFMHSNSTKFKNDTEKICKIFQSELKNEFPDARIRGIKTANFAVLRNTPYPSVLLENFFMTNKYECENYLRSEKGREKIVNYIINSIIKIDHGLSL